MKVEFLSIETVNKIAFLEKENKQLKQQLKNYEKYVERIIDLVYELDNYNSINTIHLYDYKEVSNNGL